MAQAPDPQAPRKTTTYKQFSGMNSQDGRYGVEQDELFYMENIMRVADGKLHSVGGPKAVDAQFPPGGTDVFILGTPFGDILSSPAGDLLGPS